MSEHWDVIVVGAGTAGLPAALGAADRGAKVLLIDAADDIGGTLHLSTGSYSAAGSRLQADQGITDDPGRHFTESRRITKNTGDDALLRKWQDHAADTLHWLLDAGLEVTAESLSPGAPHELYDVPRIITPKNNGYAYLDVFKMLLERASARDRITLKLSTALIGLILSEGRATVSGITIRNGDGSLEEISGKNVVLASGGFSANKSLWEDIHQRTNRTYTNGHATGGAHQLVQSLGAKLAWRESYLPTFGGTRDIDPPEPFGFHTAMLPKFRQPWEIYVNAHGQRFMAEDEPSPDARERALLAQPDEVFWCVYDHTVKIDAPPLFMWDEEKTTRAFESHPDYQTASSLEDLANKCGLNPKTLMETVSAYNEGQMTGVDAFDRCHMPAPLTKLPYFAVKHYGVSVLSFAGVKTDSDLRVLGPDGTPVANLYAAGEILGMGVFGNTYLGGAMVSSAITFGRLLGREVLRW